MNKNLPAVLVIFATFFTISFITNILGPIFPELIKSFDIGIALAGFFPFAFFAAYGVMSIPAGLLAQRLSEKFVMTLAFALAAAGSLLFALLPSFVFAMVALFLIGSAMAFLQVAINPLLRKAGGSEHFAVLSIVAQLLFGAGATLSPIVYVNLADMSQQSGHMLNTLVPAQMSWLSMYWLFAALCFVMLIWGIVTRFEGNNNEEEKAQTYTLKESLALFKNKLVIKFFFAIAAYVALEQGIANTTSLFLEQVHGLDARQVGAGIVSEFWLMLTVGCAAGLILMKLFDVRKVLAWFCIGAGISLVAAIFGSVDIALLAFPAAGFFLSIMWSAIFSLALNSFSHGHGAIAGILCTGIIGGAVISPLIGALAQVSGSLQLSLLLLFFPLGYMLHVAYTSKPIVNNHTIKLFAKRSPEQEA
ncbi:MFS transporter [Pseudoalteromonas umbrosa]|uniref:MFS transporter n=1 Tax=Pseudoalteromonas umbrosa TaxID=3048489 RepID=UPI0024C3FACC|nr:MFS transporter [Pseudoalteromonas sp. B95]MDK1288207.1 MFS transporter [Pseudoalteromonas sp. B95]